MYENVFRRKKTRRISAEFFLMVLTYQEGHLKHAGLLNESEFTRKKKTVYIAADSYKMSTGGISVNKFEHCVCSIRQ
jgi:hypothetical protein